MQPTKIYYEEIVPKSSYLNYRVGVEVIIQKNDTVDAAIDYAAREISEWHKRKHPEHYKHNEVQLTVEETELVAEIENAKEPKHLGMLKNRLTKATTPYYMEKLKSLSKATNE